MKKTHSDENTAAATTSTKSTRISRPRTKPIHRTSKESSRPSKAVKAGPATKTTKVLTLLRRAGGASMNELQKATDWQAHSVRGFISGTLKKKMGMDIVSTKQDNGERVYLVSSK
jgi:hypothetical protein